MSTRKSRFIALAAALPTAAALWAYFYTVSLTFRVVFLENSAGPLLLWHIQSHFSLASIILFAAFLIAAFVSCLLLQRKKKSLIPFAAFWHLVLTPLILSPLSVKFPEFIPLALVLLPAASIAAFLVLIFWRQKKPAVTIPLPNPAGKQTITSNGIFGPRLAPYTIWVITFFILLTSGLYVCERPGGGYTRGDVPHYFTIAKSMHQDHDIDLSNNVEGLTKHQWSGSNRFHISWYSREGHAYSWHPVGLPFIFAPFFDGNNDFRETLVIMCIIGAFLASQMYLAVFEETGNLSISLWAWIVLSFSSPLLVYLYEAWPMVPCGLCLLYAWRRMRNFEDSSFYQIVILNVSLAWLLWLHLSFIVCYAILGILLLYRLIRKLRDVRILTTVIFQALNVGIFLWFHHRWFGKHIFGLDGKILTFWPGMLGTWFDHHWGMIFAAPIHLLCFILIFVYAFRKKNLSGFTLLALYLAGFVVAASGRHWKHMLWGAHPGRRLVGLIPLTSIAFGYFLNRRKTPAFYWLAGFMSLLSLSYMLFSIMNRSGLDLPLRYLSLSCQQFRTVCFNLPAFGRNFRNFPWTHVGAVSLSFALFAFSWVILLVKERKPGSPKPLLTGMYITLLWAFLSVGWMRAYFDSPFPVPWNTSTNCVGKSSNIAGIGYPPLEKGLYRYIVHDLDKTQEKLSWSIEIKERLPTYLDLAKGMYRFQITGTGNPLSTGTASIYEPRQDRELCSSPIRVDVKGELSHEIELNLLPAVNRIRIELKPHDDDFTFKEMTITPIPAGLESLTAKIERKGEPSGWIYLD